MHSSLEARLQALAAVLATVLLAGCGVQATEEEENAQDYFHLASGLELERRDRFEIPREFAGLVVPRQETALSFELGGELAAIHVDEGDSIEAGQLLAELDTRLLSSARDDLLAQRSDLEAQLDLNRASRGRTEELKTKGFAADQRIDELESERRSLEARLERVAAELEANATRLAKSRLLSPFDGSVSERLMDEGAVASPGTPLLRVLDDFRLEARVGVPVRMSHGIRAGDRLDLRVADRALEGIVISVGSDVTAATLTVPVRLALPEGAQAVPGDQAYLQLPEPVADGGFWLPLSALTDGMRGLWNVYVMQPQAEGDLYRLESRDVRVLWSDGERAFVDGALGDGELAVSGGLHRLVPGQRVRRSQALAGG